MEYCINVNNITKSYSNKLALDNVCFSASPGRIHGLLGPNGAGKTTLIRCINRIIVPDSGDILLNGVPIEQDDVFKIGYMPEERGLYKKMKVGEQMIFFARLKGLSRAEATGKAKELLKEFDILSWWDKAIEDLSKGMAQKIQFINTIIHDPKVLILDEPFSGFDPINTEIIKSKIMEYKECGKLIILSTHDMNSVENICDEFTLLSSSKTVLAGEVSAVREKYATGMYNVEFNGINKELLRELESFCVIEDLTENGAVNSKLSICIKSGGRPKELIAHLNNSVDITVFSKKLPSMNEIFIRAVGGEIL